MHSVDSNRCINSREHTFSHVIIIPITFSCRLTITIMCRRNIQFTFSHANNSYDANYLSHRLHAALHRPSFIKTLPFHSIPSHPIPASNWKSSASNFAHQIKQSFPFVFRLRWEWECEYMHLDKLKLKINAIICIIMVSSPSVIPGKHFRLDCLILLFKIKRPYRNLSENEWCKNCYYIISHN